MRVVLALGGNALLRRGEKPDAAIQRDNLHTAISAIAAVAREHELFVVHGNGPQVGLLAKESEADLALTRPYPLGDLVAESQGLIGSWIQQGLLGAGCPTVALVTQVVVDGDDPAFHAPSKPIGALYDNATAHRLAQDRSWIVKPDGSGWRRVVASPQPVEVLGLDAAVALVHAGHTVVLGGGGGVPLRQGPQGGDTTTEPVEAVIDKDLTAALIADRVGADVLLVLTDVASVMTDYGTLEQAPISHATPAELATIRFAAGSMRPKVAACCQFVQSGQGRRAAIGALDSLTEVLAGTAGTQVTQQALIPALA